MIGKEILHYKIIEKLGQGGMGVVYKARDTKLDRDVAIKFLPPHIAGTPEERQRFEIEAKAAAALNHPNIAQVYAIEEHDNEMFIVMEYIDGKELGQIVKTQYLASLRDIIDIATQIAKGLQAAHKKGVVHRDIKSANIMVTDKGVVKIMDFGLAKIGAGSQLTKDHSTLGTAAYMSPEQARGDEVDQRTDIWSFGVLLYEMLAGKLPFKGDYEQAVIYSILNEETEIPEAIPENLKSILQKSLRKNVDNRYNSMSEILMELTNRQSDLMVNKLINNQGAGKTETPLLKKMIPAMVIILIVSVIGLLFFLKPDSLPEGRIPIAVADFENLSGEPELDALSGMLITALEQSRRLSVLTRSRMFDVLKQIGKKDISQIDEKLGTEICKKLHIRALAISTIRKFGKNYSIDLKIINPINNEYLYTAREETENQEDIPSMIDRISDKTREGLKEKEGDLIQKNQRVAIVTTANLAAYQHYFKGKEYFDRRQYRFALGELQRSVELDSTFGLAYYQLALVNFFMLKDKIAIENFERAMNLIDGIPDRENYLVRAMYEAGHRNYKEAISILFKMKEVYNDDKEMNTMIARYAHAEGNFQLAQEYFEKVFRLDPEYQLAWEEWESSFQSLYARPGFIEDGLAKLLHLKNLYPELSIVRSNLADFYSYLDRYEKAEQEYEYVLNKDQPLVSKIGNSYSQAFFLPYGGKFKKALKAFNSSIEYAKEAGDSASVGSMLSFKSILFVWGWNDIENAKLVAIEAEKYQKHLTYTLANILMYFFQQNYEKVLKITKGENEGIKTFIDLLVQAKNGNCGRLESEKKFWENSHLAILLLYHIAECQFQNKRFDKAIESINKLQKIYNNIAGFRAVYYPKSFYLLGKIYEKKGDPNPAKNNYQKFLELWKDADEDLPELIGAEKRLAELKQVVVK